MVIIVKLFKITKIITIIITEITKIITIIIEIVITSIIAIITMIETKIVLIIKILITTIGDQHYISQKTVQNTNDRDRRVHYQHRSASLDRTIPTQHNRQISRSQEDLSTRNPDFLETDADTGVRDTGNQNFH